jgi:hypothetical protein
MNCKWKTNAQFFRFSKGNKIISILTNQLGLLREHKYFSQLKLNSIKLNNLDRAI